MIGIYRPMKDLSQTRLVVNFIITLDVDLRCFRNYKSIKLCTVPLKSHSINYIVSISYNSIKRITDKTIYNSLIQVVRGEIDPNNFYNSRTSFKSIDNTDLYKELLGEQKIYKIILDHSIITNIIKNT